MIDEGSCSELSNQALYLDQSVDSSDATVRKFPIDFQASRDIEIFQDETRTGFEIPKLPFDEDSVSSITSQRSYKRKMVDEESNHVTAENLFEYQWPPGRTGDYYMLQEQISEYLGVKSFKRRYRDLQRRIVDKEEREFLRGKGVVTETQCELGLTALRSEDVIEVMAKDHADKYQEYDRVLQEKEKKRNIETHKSYSAPSVVDKTKMSEIIKRSVQAAAEYNTRFNQERREERSSIVDLQTHTIHYPIGKTAKYKVASKSVGKYPLSLITGQFQDYYRAYTPTELKYLPLNTVVYGPPSSTVNSCHETAPPSEDSMSDSDDSSTSGDSTSSQESHDGSAASSTSSDSNNKKASITDFDAPPPEGAVQCRVCNKWGGEGDLVQCSDCKTRGHPSCLELTDQMVLVIKTYEWQCMECKTCVHCRDANDEDKMMFCDKCDRGYHTFCVGLRNLPSGRWICKSCGQCTVCGTKVPGPEGSHRAQWQNEYMKNKDGDLEIVRTLCISCANSKLKDEKITKNEHEVKPPGRRPRGRPRKIWDEPISEILRDDSTT